MTQKKVQVRQLAASDTDMLVTICRSHDHLMGSFWPELLSVLMALFWPAILPEDQEMMANHTDVSS